MHNYCIPLSILCVSMFSISKNLYRERNEDASNVTNGKSFDLYAWLENGGDNPGRLCDLFRRN